MKKQIQKNIIVNFLNFKIQIYRQYINGKRVAFNFRPKETPFGGANEFIKQVTSHLAWHGAEIVYHLDPRVTHIVIMDPRWIDTSTFGVDEIQSFKNKFPKTNVILRINNCDKKYTITDYDPGAENIDLIFIKTAKIADKIIFISEWLRDYFVDKGFDIDIPHKIVHNAANDKIFYPRKEKWDSSKPLKIVTHHWSDNWLKGFKEYQEIDNLISCGILKNVEFTLIGRWPKEIQWKATKTLPPLVDMDLANELRKHDVYLTASRWEPGGMHFIEGMQCGLPVIYHRDGGGICEIASRAGLMFTNNIKEVVEQMKIEYEDLYKKALKNSPKGNELASKFTATVLSK